jgi:Skp family chaperone for outer membrane proteins
MKKIIVASCLSLALLATAASAAAATGDNNRINRAAFDALAKAIKGRGMRLGGG